MSCKALREATWIFLMSRGFILVITILAMRLPLLGQLVPRSCNFDTECFLSWWYHFDAIVYVQLALHGYSLHETVFFPLWPLLIHVVGAIFGGSVVGYYVAGLLLANIFFYFSLIVLDALLQQENFDRDVIRRVLFYLAFSPCSVFFFIGYAESLFLMLCLLTFLFLRQERYWLAGLCGFLTALTRSQGVLLVLPFLVVGYHSFVAIKATWQKRLQILCSLACIPLGVITFMAYLWFVWGDPLAFSVQEASYWHRYLTFPLLSVFGAFQALFQGSRTDLFLLNLVDILFVFVFLAVLIIGWKRIPLQYVLFGLAVALFSISYPQGVVEPLTAAPRYMLVVFPVFLILGIWGKRFFANWLITICSLVFFTTNIVFFVNHYWVA